jgi:hypothetical protein
LSFIEVKLLIGAMIINKAAKKAANCPAENLPNE